jgi:hypothetical protein
MKMRNLDKTGDWTFGKGKNNYVSDVQAIELDIKTAIYEWVNDCFFALKSGIAWNQRLDLNQKNYLEQDLRKLILRRSGVTGLIDFSLSYDSIARKFSVAYTVSTIFNKNILSGVTI